MNTNVPFQSNKPAPDVTEDRELPPMPWGWFAIAFSVEVEAGDVRTLRYFERDLVLFRTESGRAVVMDAYCPHLGAHLGYGGTVKGESLECPFHHWRFDAEGACVAVPECDRIPPKARSTKWHVVERNGLIFAWFHPEGTAPSYDFPTLEEEGWTPIRTIKWSIASHPQEVGENTVDTAHMRPVHHTLPSNVVRGPELDGAIMDLDLFFVAPGEIVGMDGDNDVKLQTTMYGLGQILAQAHIQNVDLHARYKICSTPIDREHIDIYATVAVQYNQDQAFIDEVAEIFFDVYTKDFAKDFPIWENKKYRARPVLSAADGPIGIYRKWAKQFHVEAPRSVAGGRNDDAPAAAPSGSERSAEPIHLPSPLDRLTHLVPVQRLLGRARDVLDGLMADRAGGDTPVEDDLAQMWTGPRPAATPRADQDDEAVTAPAGAKIGSAAEYFDTLHDRFVPEAARGVRAVFQWELSGHGGMTRHVVLDDGTMTLGEGPHTDPTVTIRLPAADYVRVVNGDLDGKRAFTIGGGKVTGPLRIAMKMKSIFPAT